MHIHHYCMRLPIILLFISFLSNCNQQLTKEDNPAVNPSSLVIKGADVSFLPDLRSSGVVVYNQQGQAEDMLLTLSRAGVNTLRLRLWKSPAAATAALPAMLALASEAQAMGFKILLSIHYADSWADPARQPVPADWQHLGLAALQDSVYQYTRTLVETIRPEYVQIGNEINNGFLWPQGHIANFAQFESLLQAGIQAVRDSRPDTRIVLHYAGYEQAAPFFASLHELDYDYIGLSYYPLWHGRDLTALRQALGSLHRQTAKPWLLAEFSYPFTLSWNDWTNNIIGLPEQLLPGFAASPAGQQLYVDSLRNIVQETAGGIGYCYWGAEWISYRGPTATDGSSWENQALWNFDRRALPAMQALGR